MLAQTFLVAALLTGAPEASEAIDFDTQVMPILTKAGCNAGSCHGAAAGRGGFHLSLWGSDPAADHLRITREFKGRRVNLVRPAESLLLLKPTEQIDHGGGTRLELDSLEARLIERWIEQGAQRLARRSLESLELQPSAVMLERPGQSFTVRATAHFSDGAREDVTRQTVFTPEDPAAVQVEQSEDGTQLVVARRGQHNVVVRFLDRVAVLRVVVPHSDTPIPIPDSPQDGLIDQQILTTLATLRIPPSPLSDDHTFIRRVWLDLAGRLPPPEAVSKFVADTHPDKRARLVDHLLTTEAYVDFWSLKWAKLLRIQSGSMQTEGARAFYDWLRQQIAANTPFDQLARELLLATGDRHEVGPANFAVAASGPREQAELVTESLLGIRLRCANCHDHPLDRWTQDDYHGLAAIFARVERGRIVQVGGRGEVTHPVTGQAASPRIPGVRFLNPDEDGLGALANWITSPDNPYFAKALVNRIWKEMMGRGLVEPVDDLRATNPATHPELLERLASDFVNHGFDARYLITQIATSDAYGRSSVAVDGNEADDRFYSHAIIRPLAPEVLVDAMGDVTGAREEFDGVRQGTRAVALFDSRMPAPSLDLLGRCPPDQPCSGLAADGLDLSQVLHLINGALVNAKVESPEGRLHAMLRQGASDRDFLETFYMLALSRPPSAEETEYWLQNASSADDRTAFWEDFLWSLLSSREFRHNH